MDCYKVEFLDADGYNIVEYVYVRSYDEAVLMARKIVGHPYYELTLTGV